MDITKNLCYCRQLVCQKQGQKERSWKQWITCVVWKISFINMNKLINADVLMLFFSRSIRNLIVQLNVT